MEYQHPEFPTEQALYDRLYALPASTVYGQLCQSNAWADALARLPAHMHTSVVLWVALGRAAHLGGFLHALLSNDLMRAFEKADESNLAAMRQWVMFLYNYAPAGCYGSPERVSSWQGLLPMTVEYEA